MGLYIDNNELITSEHVALDFIDSETVRGWYFEGTFYIDDFFTVYQGDYVLVDERNRHVSDFESEEYALNMGR